jgi:hypothetical protein
MNNNLMAIISTICASTHIQKSTVNNLRQYGVDNNKTVYYYPAG